jgi:hypothetical protein
MVLLLPLLVLALLLGALCCWLRPSKLKKMRCRCTAVEAALGGRTFCGGSGGSSSSSDAYQQQRSTFANINNSSMVMAVSCPCRLCLL